RRLRDGPRPWHGACTRRRPAQHGAVRARARGLRVGTRMTVEEDPMTEPADDDLHRLSMTILMTPDMSNFAGNVHGGTLLKYLDQVAYTCATRYARNYAVTLSVDQVVFREPIHVGELVTFDASVNRPGRTSMEVGVRVTTQALVSQTVRHTNSCYFTMVAIGPDGRPVPVR